MSTENIIKFSQVVANSPELQAKVQAIHAAAARETAGKIAALSVETGAPITADEFLASVAAQVAELSDEQLEAVAGGAWQPNIFNVGVSIVTLGAGCLFMAIVSKNERGDIDRCQISGDPVR